MTFKQHFKKKKVQFAYFDHLEIAMITTEGLALFSIKKAKNPTNKPQTDTIIKCDIFCGNNR